MLDIDKCYGVKESRGGRQVVVEVQIGGGGGGGYFIEFCGWRSF